jgi:hypothetical protein
MYKNKHSGGRAGSHSLGLFFLAASCLSVSSCKQECREIHQHSRDLVVNVHDLVKPITIDSPLIGRYPDVSIMDKYLLIYDHNTGENKLLHLFDKDDFTYVASTAIWGDGPGEFTKIGMGDPAYDAAHRVFYAPALNKHKIFKFYLDSVLANPSYLPETKLSLLAPTKSTGVFYRFQYFSDTLCIGPFAKTNFIRHASKWNWETGTIRPLGYEYPDLYPRDIHFEASYKHKMYATAQTYYDLITLCDWNGSLLANIYGPQWKSHSDQTIYYNGKLHFCGNKILAGFIGVNWHENRFPLKLLVFDLKGKYLKTLDFGRKISNWCYDESKNRLILAFEADDLQFGYLNLSGLVDTGRQ